MTNIDSTTLEVNSYPWIDIRIYSSEALTSVIESVSGDIVGLGNFEYPFTVENSAKFKIKLSGFKLKLNP